MSHLPRMIASMVLLMMVLLTMMLMVTLVLEFVCHSQLSILSMSATIYETIVVLLMSSIVYIVRVMEIRL